MHYPDGSIYEGIWNQDEREGQGKYEYMNGDIYEGNIYFFQVSNIWIANQAIWMGLIIKFKAMLDLWYKSFKLFELHKNDQLFI